MPQNRRRTAAILTLLLHLAAGGLATFAEAAFHSGAAAHAAVHVEAEGTACPPVHDELFCHACRVLTEIGDAACAADPAERLTRTDAGSYPQTARLHRAASFLPFGPRAPPLS